MIEFLQHLINGVSLGSVYALIALGYTMVFGVLQFINFAHGDVYMLGAFVGYYCALFFHWGDNPGLIPLLLTLLASMIVCAVVGYLIERFAYRPLRKQPRINILITAVGVSFLLEYSGQLIFGADPKFFPQVIQFEKPLFLGHLQINPLQLMVFSISLALMVALKLFIDRTKWGRALRAVSLNPQWAALMGIPVNTMISLTFMLGSALAGAAGVLVGLTYPKIDPLMGIFPGLKAFTAAVLGGVGNIQGAVLGALVIGVAEELVVGYVSSTYRDALSFGILVLILLLRPTGLLGSRVSEKV